MKDIYATTRWEDETRAIKQKKPDWLPDPWWRYGLGRKDVVEAVESMRLVDPDWARNDEHLLHMAVTRYLKGKSSFSLAELDSFIEALASCAEHPYSDQPLFELARHGSLALEQLEHLAQSPECARPELQRVIRTRSLLKRLETEGATPEVFELATSRPDRVVQLALVNHESTSESQLMLLREDGANRAIRSIARQRLQSLGR